MKAPMFTQRPFSIVDTCAQPILGTTLFTIFDTMKRFVWRKADNSEMGALYKAGYLACRISQPRLGTLTGIERRQTIAEYTRQMEVMGWVNTLRPDRCYIYVLGEIGADGGEIFYQSNWLDDLEKYIQETYEVPDDEPEVDHPDDLSIASLAPSLRKEATLAFLAKRHDLKPEFVPQNLEGKDNGEMTPEEAVREFLNSRSRKVLAPSPTALRAAISPSRRVGPKWLDRSVGATHTCGKEDDTRAVDRTYNVRHTVPRIDKTQSKEPLNTIGADPDQNSDQIMDSNLGSDLISDQGIDLTKETDQGGDGKTESAPGKALAEAAIQEASQRAQAALGVRRARARAKARAELRLSSKIPEERQLLIRALYNRWKRYDQDRGVQTKWMPPEINIVNMLANTYDNGEDLLGITEYLLSRWDSINERYLKGKGLAPSLSILYRFHSGLAEEARIYTMYREASERLDKWKADNKGKYPDAALVKEVKTLKEKLDSLENKK